MSVTTPDVPRRPDTGNGTGTRAALYIALLVAGTLALALPAAAAGPERGILWRVERGGETLGHLLGTIHSDRPEVIDLPTPIERAFEGADRYAFEIDQRNIDPQELLRIMHYPDGVSLAQRLPSDLWERARRAASRRGLPGNAITSMEPWALAMVLSLPPADPRNILDMMLQRRALDSGQPVFGLETVAEQLSIFDRLDESHQIEMLTIAVETIESGKADELFEQMVRAWRERDLRRIVELADDYPAIADPATNDRLMRELLEKRNQRMVVRMKPALEAGGAFIAVGAMHLAGDEGLVRLLERRGYTLTAVY